MNRNISISSFPRMHSIRNGQKLSTTRTFLPFPNLHWRILLYHLPIRINVFQIPSIKINPPIIFIPKLAPACLKKSVFRNNPYILLRSSSCPLPSIFSNSPNRGPSPFSRNQRLEATTAHLGTALIDISHSTFQLLFRVHNSS